MIKTEEKGITLMTLVVTIVVLLILVAIGATSGITTINETRFSQFKNELEILQIKVNELNQNNETNIGTENFSKDIFSKKTITDIIYQNISNNEEKLKIQEGFKYCTASEIKDKLGLESIERDYLINVEKRYVIYYEGFEYNGVTYYMIDQMESGIYNVRYNDKSIQSEENDFNVEAIQESDRWRIEISDIKNQYINNWKVQYRMETDSYWKNANSLTFYITQKGNYYVQLVHDEITLGPKRIELIE